MMAEIDLAQALGFLSFGLGISTFYQKNDRHLKILMLVFNLNHLLHFLLLGSMLSALSALLSALRTTTSIFTSSKWVAAIFILIGIVSGLGMAEHWWELWPIVGTVIGTYSLFVLSGIRMRIGFLAGATCWLINNILVGSIGGTLLEMTVIIINLITIYRLYRQPLLPVTQKTG
ncbi:YgjV family protein [Vibrio vulnificus]|uniref:YgjV family protein n=1 Tax=Vibrio vulnificus TaxID=672 RepID=UPI0009B6AA51|nr:YgjV family protein [Vibrio vulnificus]EGQ7939828.1 YgjV family protein [Vibrio vulnificus]EGQ9309757.1 YgjV family protein [Vibrio vulnificus]EGR0232793.1 YgjV family protein [Vibrio vulnificus]EHD0093448.1 YgjV family protein [Vibrio vulnificus]EHH0711436.1 YgjV family protein [Vibrio vulnificus]